MKKIKEYIANQFKVDQMIIDKITLYDSENKNELNILVDKKDLYFKVPNIKDIYIVKIDVISRDFKCWYAFKVILINKKYYIFAYYQYYY